MYSILVVDDERIIREGVCELLLAEESLEMDVLSAASVDEALPLLETHRVDIVLTDIQMPKISGLEFYDIILERWPHCKVIFLTGFPEFDHVYKVQRRARYVLKAEGDEKIIDAVREAIEELENDLYLTQVVQDSSELLRMNKEAETQMLFRDMLSGYLPSSAFTQALANRLDIPLDVSHEAFYIVMYHRFPGGESYEGRLEHSSLLKDLVWKYFNYQMRGIHILYTRNFGLLLLQDGNPGMTACSARLEGSSELFQKAYGRNFEGTVSLNVGIRPLAIAAIIDRFHLLRSELLAHDEEALLVDKPDTQDAGSGGKTAVGFLYARIQMLDFYFENNDVEGASAIIQEAQEACREATSMHDLSVINIYTAIASKLIAYTTQLSLSEHMGFRIGVANLYILNLHENWQDAFDYLLSVAMAIFELRQTNAQQQYQDIIGQTKAYILAHLDGDTSLSRLAEHVAVSPEHLLRLFKKSEGTTILKYINDLKVVKAKNLLKDGSRRIKDIAGELGFTSSGYFGRFFRERTGLSPQAWRDQY